MKNWQIVEIKRPEEDGADDDKEEKFPPLVDHSWGAEVCCCPRAFQCHLEYWSIGGQTLVLQFLHLLWTRHWQKVKKKVTTFPPPAPSRLHPVREVLLRQCRQAHRCRAERSSGFREMDS